MALLRFPPAPPAACQRARDQNRVVPAADAMPDPLGPQAVQRLPDRRGPGHLAGVRHAVQPGRDGSGEHRAEGVGEGGPRLLDPGQTGL